MILHNYYSCLVIFVIIGVTIAEEFPISTVSIHFKGKHLCSGALITLRHVIASASCVCKMEVVHNNKTLFVQIGPNIDNPIDKVLVSILDCHDRFVHYEPYGSLKDVAVLKLSKYPKLSDRELNEVAVTNLIFEKCVLYVWRAGNLVMIDNIKIEKINICERYMNERMRSDQLCSMAPQYNISDIDRGSPLYCNNKIHAIYSWKPPYAGRTTVPYIYTNIAEHYKFFWNAFKKMGQ